MHSRHLVSCVSSFALAAKYVVGMLFLSVSRCSQFQFTAAMFTSQKVIPHGINRTCKFETCWLVSYKDRSSFLSNKRSRLQQDRLTCTKPKYLWTCIPWSNLACATRNTIAALYSKHQNVISYFFNPTFNEYQIKKGIFTERIFLWHPTDRAKQHSMTIKSRLKDE